jgi:hypothetical protein
MPILFLFFTYPPYDFAVPLFKLHPLARAAVPQAVLNPLAMTSARMCVAYWSLLHGADAVWKQRFRLSNISVTPTTVLPRLNCQFGVCLCRRRTYLIRVSKALSEHNRNSLKELMFFIGIKSVYSHF